ncbi:MAG TPA: hypothetical protein VFB58_11140 [Chloroflexota bacterium]|nr:hypothetical protein [Chloroflexota bacterium]
MGKLKDFSHSKVLPTLMLGPPKQRDLDRCVLVSLDRLVPPHHVYRHLERTLDLSFVRECVVRGRRGSGVCLNRLVCA